MTDSQSKAVERLADRHLTCLMPECSACLLLTALRELLTALSEAEAKLAESEQTRRYEKELHATTERALEARLREVEADRDRKARRTGPPRSSASESELAAARETLDNAAATFAHAFPDRQFDAGPPEQRIAMLLIRQERELAAACARADEATKRCAELERALKQRVGVRCSRCAMAEVGLPTPGYPHNERCAEKRCEELQRELSLVDSVLARRPALDRPTRFENIEKAISVAAKAESELAEAKAKLAEAREAIGCGGSLTEPCVDAIDPCWEHRLEKSERLVREGSVMIVERGRLIRELEAKLAVKNEEMKRLRRHRP